MVNKCVFNITLVQLQLTLLVSFKTKSYDVHGTLKE